MRWDAGNESSVGTVEQKITEDIRAAVHHPDKLHKA